MSKNYIYLDTDGTQKAGLLDLDGAPGTLYHTATVMPDLSLLGYTGDPNNANPANNPGEQLLYNSGIGTWFIDKGVDPNLIWVKTQDIAGGDWEQVFNYEGTLDCGSFV